MATTKIVQTLNEIRKTASYDYNNRIPLATANNIANIAETLATYTPAANEFLGALINRIIRVIITSKLYENPWAAFKRGGEGFGDTIEEIYANIATAHEYNPELAESEVFKREIPDLSAVFHRINSRLFYKATIQNESLRTAVTDDAGLEALIGTIVNSLYSGANYDEYLTMVRLLGANMGYYYPVNVPEPTAVNSNAIVTAIKGASNMMTFGGGKYNRYGVFNFTAKENQVLIMRADVDALIDVNSLAAAFNLEYRQFMGRRIIVDSFPPGMENVVAMLTDDKFLMVYDNLDKFTEQYNAQGLYWNYFFHVWRTYSVSPFSNVIIFTTDVTVEPTTVAFVSPPATYTPGTNYQLNAQVNSGAAGAPQGVKFTLEGNTSTSTYITATGMLCVGEMETGSLTVKATSTYNTSISTSVTINSASRALNAGKPVAPSTANE